MGDYPVRGTGILQESILRKAVLLEATPEDFHRKGGGHNYLWTATLRLLTYLSRRTISPIRFRLSASLPSAPSVHLHLQSVHSLHKNSKRHPR